jgi:PAS domain S-box-containing protein
MGHGGAEVAEPLRGKVPPLIDKSLAGVFVYHDEKILFANSRLGEMLGYAAQDMIGMPLWDLFHDQDRPKVRDLVLKRLAEGTTDLHYDARFVRRDGKAFWAEVLSSVSNYEGRPAVLVNVYNITARKESEEKRRRRE